MANIESAQIEDCLKDMKFPANRAEIISWAQRQGADDQMVSQMRRLSDQSYKSISEVISAMGANQSHGEQNRAGGSRNQH